MLSYLLTLGGRIECYSCDCDRRKRIDEEGSPHLSELEIEISLHTFSWCRVLFYVIIFGDFNYFREVVNITWIQPDLI